jgi:hypothetical protein
MEISKSSKKPLFSKAKCRYREDCFEYQFPHWQAGYFSLRGQRKVAKRIPPDAACFLRFSHLPGVAGRDFPVPPATRGIPAAPLTG